jgi:hypothetical protein
LLPVVAMCADKKKKPKPMPVSRWREVMRMTPDSSVVSFTDTLFMAFQKNDSFSYNTRDGFVYIGAYTISEDSLLDFGTARYQIVQRKPKSLTLANSTGIFRFEPDWSDTAKIIVLEKDEKPLPVTDIDQMIGRWAAYKRTAADDAGAQDGDNIIRSVYITGPSSTENKQGFVFSSKDPQNAPSWVIKGLGADQVLTCDGKTNKTLKVIKCQKGEMILEDAGVKYYFKQFK